MFKHIRISLLIFGMLPPLGRLDNVDAKNKAVSVLRGQAASIIFDGQAARSSGVDQEAGNSSGGQVREPDWGEPDGIG